MHTDSKSLFDVITKCSKKQERRLMIDLQAVRDAYKAHEISNVGFIRGPNNLADGMTKPFKCDPLNDLLRTGKEIFSVEQWVIRSSDTNTANAVPNDDHDSSTNYPINHDQLTADQTRDICNIACTTYHSAISSNTAFPRMLRKQSPAYSVIQEAIICNMSPRPACITTRWFARSAP